MHESFEKLYFVYDKMSGRPVHFCFALNDSMAVRNVLMTLRFTLKDHELYEIGDMKRCFDDNQQLIDVGLDVNFQFHSPRKVDWKAYRFPENVSEALAPLGASPEEISAIANAKIKEIGDNDRSEVQSMVSSQLNGENANA